MDIKAKEQTQNNLFFTHTYCVKIQWVSQLSSLRMQKYSYHSSLSITKAKNKNHVSRNFMVILGQTLLIQY